MRVRIDSERIEPPVPFAASSLRIARHLGYKVKVKVRVRVRVGDRES